MKKIISLVLVLFALVPSAFAENTIDLESLSTEQLLSLKESINQELASRNFENKEVTVPPGRYTIGQDIPEGVYTVTFDGSVMAMVTTYTKKGDVDLMYSVSKSDPIGKLELSDGQIVEISVQSVIFSQYAGMGF